MALAECIHKSHLSLQGKVKNRLRPKYTGLSKFNSNNHVIVKFELKNLMYSYVGNEDQDLAEIGFLALKL